MGVTLNENLTLNLLYALDTNYDNNISIREFENAFEKYLGTGGAVKTLNADDVKKELGSIKGLDDATAKSLAKQMNNEQKKTQVYKDQTLEEISLDELEARNQKLLA